MNRVFRVVDGRPGIKADFLLDCLNAYEEHVGDDEMHNLAMALWLPVAVILIVEHTAPLAAKHGGHAHYMSLMEWAEDPQVEGIAKARAAVRWVRDLTCTAPDAPPTSPSTAQAQGGGACGVTAGGEAPERAPSKGGSGEADGATLGEGDWLMPPLSLADLANRLGNIGNDKAKTALKPFGLREWGNRQSWTVRLDLMPANMRAKLLERK